MATQSQHRLRLKADLAHFDAPIDAYTNTLAAVWRKADTQIEFALFHDGTLLNVSNLASVTFAIKPTTEAGQAPASDATALASGMVLAASLNDTLTETQWNAGTHQHGLISLDRDDLDIEATDAAWFTLSATTTDTPAKTLVLGAGPLRVLEGGV